MHGYTGKGELRELSAAQRARAQSLQPSACCGCPPARGSAPRQAKPCGGAGGGVG